ncbi:MAG: flavin reductase family protein [Pseudomonadota bacterium]
MTVNEQDFRDALGRFATGVTVVSCLEEGGDPGRERAVGFTANSFTSLSLDPPLVLWCIDKLATGYRLFTETDHFTINLLSSEQKSLAMRMANAADNGLQADEWMPGGHGQPLIRGSIGALECARETLFPGGDHTIIVARVLAAHGHEGEPLIYFKGQFSARQKALG